MADKSPFHSLSNSEIRDYCRATLEALEHWLRRLIDEVLSKEYGSNYIEAKDANGNHVINSAIRKYLNTRLTQEPGRYSRPIDAALLDNAVDIICNPVLYKQFFSNVFQSAFPDGRDEARTFFKRLVEPRNRLSHANPISVRQAEQIICYSHDIIDSLKNYYQRIGASMEYNVPLIIKMSDSFGNVTYVSQLPHSGHGQVVVDFTSDPKCFLRPGDFLSIELEIDPNFPESSYTLRWASQPDVGLTNNSTKLSLQITEAAIATHFTLMCTLISNQQWHKYSTGVDELLLVFYKVLPL